MQIMIDTLQLSPRYDKPLLEALGGRTLEVFFPRRNNGRPRGKHADLVASGELATFCDVDHRIGRAHLWQNGAWFTRAVSHGYNTALTHTRREAGDWLFGSWPFRTHAASSDKCESQRSSPTIEGILATQYPQCRENFGHS